MKRTPRSLVRSASNRVSASREKLRAERQARAERKAFSGWLASVRRHRTEVLIGANFAEHGGVRNHIHAIERYSSLRVRLAPSDALLEIVSPHEVKTTFRDEFLAFDTTGIKAIHSHVFPWFIEWCSQKRRDGLRWVHTYHLPYFPEHARGELEPWQREFNDTLLGVARNADVRISVSRWQSEYLLSEHGIETIYIPNGVDVALCDAGDADRFVKAAGRRDFVLFAGRAEPVKNPAEFVRLASTLPDVDFAMAGPGLSAGTLAEQFGVQVPRNVALLGELSHAELMDAIAACSALVVTSKREGLPTVVLEAMALAKPVVVPNERGCVEAIGDGEFGFVYDPGDVDDLAAKTLTALSDKQRCSRSRARVLAEFDWRVVASQLDAVYRGEKIAV